MTDRILLENQIAIMSALVEIAHAVGYGTKMSAAETITSLRQRVQESERSLASPIWQTGYMSAERHLSADEQAIKDEAIRRDILKRAKSKRT